MTPALAFSFFYVSYPFWRTLFTDLESPAEKDATPMTREASKGRAPFSSFPFETGKGHLIFLPS